MDDLITEFVAESREMLDALGGAIVAWEATPDDRTRLDEIFRFVHTVKGNSGFFDMPRLSALSHAAEDVLADVRAGRRGADAALVSAVLATVDRIGALVEALDGAPAPEDDDDRLIGALKGVAQPAPDIIALPEQRRPARSIRLPVELLDRMMSSVSDMVLARNELARRLRETDADAPLLDAFERVSACIADMRDSITRTRMQRIETLFSSLPRLARDLAAELGKSVEFQIDGGDVELDREMIEMIRDPLTHIVRNAIDHGLESGPERARAGKLAKGMLRVCARQSGNQILIEVIDDGKGIDGAAVLRKAIGAGLVGEEEAGRFSPAQKLDLVFQPGLSTAPEVTAISGRGVGLDVVRANIERVGGTVEIDSEPGRGLRLILRLPLTLTIIPALTVSAGGRVYAIPRSAIEEIVRCRSEAVRIEHVGGSPVARVRDKQLPLVSLPAALGVVATAEPIEQSLIVLKPAGGEPYALAVDAVHDHEELVVKPAAPAVMATGLYAGTTIADDGSPVLLLDASGIATRAGLLSGHDRHRQSAVVKADDDPEPTAPALLFRGLDGVKRAIRLAVVERIEDVPVEAVQWSAGRLRVAINNRILQLAGCNTVPERPLRLMRLNDGVSQLAYGFSEVLDIVQLRDEVTAAEVPGEVAGVVLLGGDQVELIDPYWLFASAAAEPQGQQPLCLIPGEDPWMVNILRPIIQAAGYRVQLAGLASDEPADLGDCPRGQGGVCGARRRRHHPHPDHARGQWGRGRQHLPL
jgi:two-component system chemotaxis sensor kinase CheA